MHIAYKTAAVLISISILLSIQIFVYRSGVSAGYEKKSHEIISSDLIAAREAVKNINAAFDQTNKFLLEIHDDAPDNKNPASPSITRTLDSMHQRQAKNGRVNTAPRN